MRAATLLALSFFVGAVILGSNPARALDPVNNSLFSDVAIHFTFKWRGALWRFVSAADRDAFAASPEKYAPQFGGYCAWAVSQGYTADIDPNAWKVVNGKLYLNYDKEVQKKWEANQAANISAAEVKWPALLKE